MVAVVVREQAAPYGQATLGKERRPSSVSARSTAPQIAPPPAEATLAQLWAGQRFPASALVTRQGMPLRVLHPGWPGRGAGPDFRDAIIATPSDRLLRGDVELHVRASDFRAHGHHTDPRYNGVVLHLVFEDDAAADTRLASGRRVPGTPRERVNQRANPLGRILQIRSADLHAASSEGISRATMLARPRPESGRGLCSNPTSLRPLPDSGRGVWGARKRV